MSGCGVGFGGVGGESARLAQRHRAKHQGGEDLRKNEVVVRKLKYSFLVVSHNSIRGCVRPSVRRSVGRLIRNAFFSAGSDEPANDLFRVYELVDKSFYPTII